MSRQDTGGAATGAPDPAQSASDALCRFLGDSLRAVYLHGSATSGGLRPRSDIDLLAIIDHPMREADRRRLLSMMLELSGSHPPPPGGPRCLDLSVFLVADLAVPTCPARAEFIYGEWLREDFLAGASPGPVVSPDNTLVLAQARQNAQTLYGPPASDLLPEIPPAQIRMAMRDTLPDLVGGLIGDERNVLLTLARMWRTSATGEFVPKDAAATWAASRAPRQVADTLATARDGYLGMVQDDWASRQTVARLAAAYLHRRVLDLL